MTAGGTLDHPWYDASRAPVYLWTFPPSPTTDEMAEGLAARERFVAGLEEPSAWVMDLRQLLGPDAVRRRLASAHMERTAPYDARFNRGCAIVVPGPVSRGMIAAVFWLSPPSFRWTVVASVEDGFAWAERRIRSPSLPPRM